jgi:hypothetical protein
MLRTLFVSVAALALFGGGLLADDKKADKAGKHEHKALFVKADLKKNTVTFTTTDKAGKKVTMTLPLAKDAKIYGEKHDAETLAKFVANMEKEKDKAIRIVEDKDEKHIIEIDDLPPGK